MKLFLLTLSFCLTLLVAEAAEHDEFDEELFCPVETNKDRCRSKDKAYKCGLFFKNLNPNGDLTYIGSVPEALEKAMDEGVSEEDVTTILGSALTAKDYSDIECSDSLVNDKCAAQMDSATRDFDECTKSTFLKDWKEDAKETTGDALCTMVHEYYVANQLKDKSGHDDYTANGKDNIEVTYMYSMCGGDWTEVKDKETKLMAGEQLCCTNKGKFKRCDGSDFKKTCN